VKNSIFSNKSGKPGHGLFPYRSEYLALYDLYNQEIYYESGNAKVQPPSLAEVYVFYMIWAGPARRVPREFQNPKPLLKKQGESEADASARNRSRDFVDYFRSKGFETNSGQVLSCKPEVFMRAFRTSFIRPPPESYQRGRQWGTKSREQYTRSVRNFVMVLNNRKIVSGEPLIGKTFRVIPGKVQIPEAMKAMIFKTCKHEVCSSSCGNCTKCLVKAIALRDSVTKMEENRANQKKKVAERPRITAEEMMLLRSSRFNRKFWKAIILKYTLGERRGSFEAFLNGQCGEFTNSDDVESGKGGKLCEKTHGPDSCKKPIFHSMPGKKSSPEAERRLATKQEKEQGYKISKLTFCHESAITHICVCPGNRKIFHLTKTQQEEWVNNKVSESRACLSAVVGEELEGKALSGVSGEDLKKEIQAFDKLVDQDVEEELEDDKECVLSPEIPHKDDKPTRALQEEELKDDKEYVFSPKIPHKDDKPTCALQNQGWTSFTSNKVPPGNKLVIPACIMSAAKPKKNKVIKSKILVEKPVDEDVEMVVLKKELPTKTVEEDATKQENIQPIANVEQRNHDQVFKPVVPPMIDLEVEFPDEEVLLDIVGEPDEGGEEELVGETRFIEVEADIDIENQVEHRNQDRGEIPVVPLDQEEVEEVDRNIVRHPLIDRRVLHPYDVPRRVFFGPRNNPAYGRFSDSESDTDSGSDSDTGSDATVKERVRKENPGFKKNLEPCYPLSEGYKYLPGEGLKTVMLGTNAASDVDLRSMIEKCCIGLFDFILYKKKSNVVRISDNQLCDLHQTEEGERSLINRFCRGVAYNINTMANGNWADFSKNNTQAEVMVIVRSRKYRGDVTKKLWKFSREAKVFDELYRAIMRNTMPMSSVGSLKNPTQVHMYLFSRIGEQIAEFCDKQKVLGYLEVENAAIVANTIAYIHNTMVVNFNLGLSSCQEFSVSPGALTFSLTR